MSIDRSDVPRIGITTGDAAGVGPEIAMKALADPTLSKNASYLVIGDRRELDRVAAELGLTGIPQAENISVIDLDNLSADRPTGIDSPITGRASAENLEMAVSLWRSGEIDAVVTAPISKRAIAMGGYDFAGHTEFLAELTGSNHVAMSFWAGSLRTVLLSTHLPLREAIDLVRSRKLIELIEFADIELEKLLGKRPKLAIAGLNPHASESGLFGREEADEIIPAVEYCHDELGIDISGPFSPDTVFLRCAKGEFDAVVALYHDQATIPVKSIAFNAGVNVTLGLPLVRTSVDHGTAYDIAGKGVAEHASMLAAIDLAVDLVSRS